MAALDFGMALARGMLPKSEAAQKDLIHLAGGRNIFKSEDWWNKQVDKQISEGFRETRKGQIYKTISGDWAIRGGESKQLGTSSKRGFVQTVPVKISEQGVLEGTFSPGQFEAPTDALIKGTRGTSVGPITMSAFGYTGPAPIYETKEVDYFVGTYDPVKRRAVTDRKNFTVGELSDIESSAKAGAQRAKREAAKAETSQKRLRRGTGGLAAKAAPVGAKGATGLPDLGAGGLQLGQTTLGKGLFV